MASPSIRLRRKKIAFIVGFYVLWLAWLDADHFSGIEKQNGHGQFYINRVYYILTTLSSVGYGDIYPISAPARLAAGTIMFFMLLGAV